MTQKQLSDLVFSIGETILLEVKEIKRVDYPKSEFPDTVIIELRGGDKFELYLRPLGEY